MVIEKECYNVMERSKIDFAHTTKEFIYYAVQLLNTQKEMKRMQHNTPASTYLRSRELVRTMMTVNRPIRAMHHMDDMLACISELEREYWSQCYHNDATTSWSDLKTRFHAHTKEFIYHND